MFTSVGLSVSGDLLRPGPKVCGTVPGCQWWSAGGNIPGWNFGQYRTEPSAKDRNKFPALGWAGVLEHSCGSRDERSVGNEDGALSGALLVLRKNPRRYGCDRDRLRLAGFTSPCYLHRDRPCAGHQLKRDLRIGLRPGDENQRGRNIVEGYAGVSQCLGKRYFNRQQGIAGQVRPEDGHDRAGAMAPSGSVPARKLAPLTTELGGSVGLGTPDPGGSKLTVTLKLSYPPSMVKPTWDVDTAFWTYLLGLS